MSRIKFGIDLGTTNSAIALLDKGVSKIKKNLQTQGDTTPSVVSLNRGVSVGQRAFNDLKNDNTNALKSGKQNSSNVFQEFKRTMGTDHKYFSEKMDRSYSSQELSAEVLKELKRFTQEEFKSVIITIPAMFNDSQRSATVEAANLAGFEQVELLQEPIAAATAFGLDEEIKDGYILVFDFGGGTFDVCLIQVQEGIMQVKDTGGDNWLGGKNLDEAIVDKIILPKLMEDFKIDSYINDDLKSLQLKTCLKRYAEDIKKELSFNNSSTVGSDLNDFPDDDEGKEIFVDITVTESDLEQAVGPVFKKAIDISLEVLKRNNLKGSDLSSLLLVGGPTFSPILRKMIEKQICKPNTNVDPMTVVARGAAIYAARFEVSDEIRAENKDDTKIQLDLGYKSVTAEKNDWLAISVDKSKTTCHIPDQLYFTVNRSDGGWQSEKILLGDTGEMIELVLNKGVNLFEIILEDSKGNKVAHEPADEIQILGDTPEGGEATLAYNYGIEVGVENKVVFKTVEGLEKNKTIPVSGEMRGLRTKKDIRPGSDDHFKIPIYMGDEGADNTRASSHTHVNTVKISGMEFAKLLPMNSEINLILEIKSDSEKNLSVDIPYLNETFDFPLEKITQESEGDQWFDEQFEAFEMEINALKSDQSNFDLIKLAELEESIKGVKTNYENRKNEADTKMMTRDNIRKQFAELDKLINENEWPAAEKDLNDLYNQISQNVHDSNDKSKHQSQLSNFKSQIDKVIERKDIKLAKELKLVMTYYFQELLEAEYGADLYISWLQQYNSTFNNHPWSDRSKARAILDTALKTAALNPTKESMKNYVQQLWRLLPTKDGGRKDILGG